VYVAGQGEGCNHVILQSSASKLIRTALDIREIAELHLVEGILISNTSV